MTKDGTEIYDKGWGAGPVVTFSYGWPLGAKEIFYDPGAPQGLTATLQDQVNADLLAFQRG